MQGVYRYLIPCALLISALVAGPAKAAEAEDEHAAHAAGIEALALRLDAGKRWATDTPLRAGMTAIRKGFVTNHDAHHDDTMTAAQALALADQVDTEVRTMIANCKLPPAADAELHKVLAAMLGAVNTLRSTEYGPGMPQLHQAILAYGEFFDHPGWDE